MRRGRTAFVVVLLLLTWPPTGASVETTPIDPSLEVGTDAETSVIVSFDREPREEALDQVARLGEVRHVYHVIDAAHVVLPGSNIVLLARLDAVQRVDADEPLELHLDTSRPAVRVGPPVWGAGFTGTNATIAVVDTGIDGTHPAVQDRVLRSVTFTGSGSGPAESTTGTDTDGHGTHVAGITASSGSSSELLDPDDTKYAGIAPDAKLVSLDISASFTTSTAIRAFEWIHDNHEAYGIEVVQNSWGRKETGQAFDRNDPAIRASNALVVDDDLVVVFSAANEGPEPQSLSMEAMNPNVLTVAATDDGGEVAEFSSRGPVELPDGSKAPWVKPDVSAPGVSIRSAASSQEATSQGLYKALSGTSQAAPHVAGVAGLIRDRLPDLPAQAVMDAITTTTRDLGPSGPDPDTGYGMVRADHAIDAAMEEANVSLASRTETYTGEGRLVLGLDTGNILPQDTGARTSGANGSFPVKPDAESLVFTFNWTSATLADAPDLDVQLTDANGRVVLLPVENQRAERSLDAPVPGEWTWTARPASDLEAGAVDYRFKATVTLASQERLAGAGGAEGGYFDDSFSARIERLFEDAADAYGIGPVLAALAVSGLLLLTLLATVVRRIRG